jgi:hypothetical protein
MQNESLILRSADVVLSATSKHNSEEGIWKACVHATTESGQTNQWDNSSEKTKIFT